jgi:hypothetical protein
MTDMVVIGQKKKKSKNQVLIEEKLDEINVRF